MSQFLNSSDHLSRDSVHEIDFEEATRLTAGGSTCDIFRTRWQRREVFVKRLKEELRMMPLYLDALDKEFDVGVRLHHPSLPVYHEFHRDYIVMDYVDGLTLAEMIRRNDAWLTSERNVVKMLRELVEVVDYLHRHNVVHCDIKPDNIIITANTKNLVLIDFDKSYTDALADSSGHPGRYGLSVDDRGRTTIDFRAIAMVVERLRADVKGFRLSVGHKFVKACLDSDINSETLLEILSERSRGGPVTKYIFIIVLTMMALGLLIGKVYFDRQPEYDVRSTEVVAPDAASQQEDSTAATVRRLSPESAPEPQHPAPMPQAIIEPTDLNANLEPLFNGLIAGLDKLDAMRADTTLSRQQLVENWEVYLALEEAVITDSTVSVVTGLFPEISERKMSVMVSATDAYKSYLRRANAVKAEVISVIED